MKKHFIYRSSRAFALPTVILVSVVMLGILIAILSGLSSSTSALSSQYYQQLAKEAAEAGIIYAQQCYQTQSSNSFPAGQWPNSGYYLTADTACSGAANPTTPPTSLVAYPNASTASGGTNAESWFVVAPFAVAPSAGSISYNLSVTGYAAIKSTSGTLTKTYSTAISGQYPVSIYGVASGNDTTCAIQSGQLYCWGDNRSGQVGNGTIGDYNTNSTNPNNYQTTPYHVQGALAGLYVQYVATGKTFTCAVAGPTPVPSLSSLNKIYCWGDNSSYNYGTSQASSLVPVAATPITGRYIGCPTVYPSPRPSCTPISAGNQTCVLGIASTTNSAEYCWGTNPVGQAGESSPGSVTDPKTSPGNAIRLQANTAYLTGVQNVTSVSGDFSCNVDTSQTGAFTAYCWGNNGDGQYGNGTTGNPNPINGQAYRSTGGTGSPVISGIFKIANNASHVCALKSGSGLAASVYCWGGQDAQGSMAWLIDRSLSADKIVNPTNLVVKYNGTTLTNISDIALADAATCVVNNGSVYCWGANYYGQLGSGTIDGSAAPPWAQPTVGAGNASLVGGPLVGKNVVSITSGNFHFCAMTSTAQTYCWGGNFHGQLGTGKTTPSSIPTPTLVRLPVSVNF